MTTPTPERTRRVPTPEELRIWRAFTETGEHLRGLMAARLQDDSGLSSGDYMVLLALSEVDGKQLRSSELAAQIEWERSRLSHHLGRMESRGLIRRELCATDNRGAEVILTPAGASLFRKASAPHLHAVQELFIDALTPELLAHVDAVVAALQLHLGSVTHGRLEDKPAS